MYPECEGVDLPAVLDLAGALEEGGRPRRGEAAGAEEEDAGDLGLRLRGELEDDAGVVAGGGQVVELAVVDLEDEVLDARSLAHSGRDRKEIVWGI